MRKHEFISSIAVNDMLEQGFWREREERYVDLSALDAGFCITKLRRALCRALLRLIALRNRGSLVFGNIVFWERAFRQLPAIGFCIQRYYQRAYCLGFLCNHMCCGSHRRFRKFLRNDIVIAMCVCVQALEIKYDFPVTMW